MASIYESFSIQRVWTKGPLTLTHRLMRHCLVACDSPSRWAVFTLTAAHFVLIVSSHTWQRRRCTNGAEVAHRAVKLRRVRVVLSGGAIVASGARSCVVCVTCPWAEVSCWTWQAIRQIGVSPGRRDGSGWTWCRCGGLLRTVLTGRTHPLCRVWFRRVAVAVVTSVARPTRSGEVTDLTIESWIAGNGVSYTRGAVIPWPAGAATVVLERTAALGENADVVSGGRHGHVGAAGTVPSGTAVTGRRRETVNWKNKTTPECQTLIKGFHFPTLPFTI